MWRTTLFLFVTLSSLGCSSAIGPRQPDGRDCNYAEAATACGPSSYCDPGVRGGDGSFARKRVYGLTGDKTHVVGTCRAKGAARAPCQDANWCTSGRCMHASPIVPGVCE